jgi:hypothetical protein
MPAKGCKGDGVHVVCLLNSGEKIARLAGALFDYANRLGKSIGPISLRVANIQTS